MIGEGENDQSKESVITIWNEEGRKTKTKQNDMKRK